MKISPAPLTLPPDQTVSNHRPGNNAPVPCRAYSSDQGRESIVELSTVGRQLAQKHQSHSNLDQIQVQQLREAIKSGCLTIDARRIADSLIGMARDMAE